MPDGSSGSSDTDPASSGTAPASSDTDPADSPVFELGSEEWASLPDLDIPAVLAKIDTGARTSALHATRVEVLGGANGERVRFTVHPVAGRRDIVRNCEAPLAGRRWVTSSNGARELRCVVATQVAIGDRRWPIEVTLTNRRSMRYRMLLGQRAILDDMIVLPGRPNRQAVIGHDVYADMPGSNSRATGSKSGRAGGGGASPRIGPLTIGLLGEAPVGPSWQRLVQAALRRGHLVERIDPRACRLLLGPGMPRIECAGRLLPALDAVIALLDPDADPFALAIARHLERMGVGLVNGSRGIAAALDAALGWQALCGERVPVAISSLTISSLKVAGPERLRPRSTSVRVLVAAGQVVAAQVLPDSSRQRAANRRPPATAVHLPLAERRLAVWAAGVLGLGLAHIDLVRQDLGEGQGETVVAGFGMAPAILDLPPSSRSDPARAVIKAMESRVRAGGAIAAG